MKSEPLSNNCETIYSRKEHVCFGISPFNSYFSESKIRDLAVWGLDNFKAMHFFMPDVPAAYTLVAIGYSSEKAEWKARRQSKGLRNKIARVLQELSFSNNEIDEMIVDWKRLSSSEAYQTSFQSFSNLFDSDLLFRNDCLQASRWVMENKVPDPSDLTEDVLLLAVKYFLSELPLFADTASILNQKSSVFCYHQKVDFLEKLFNFNLTCRPAQNQGFIVVNSEQPQFRSESQASL